MQRFFRGAQDLVLVQLTLIMQKMIIKPLLGVVVLLHLSYFEEETSGAKTTQLSFTLDRWRKSPAFLGDLQF